RPAVSSTSARRAGRSSRSGGVDSWVVLVRWGGMGETEVLLVAEQLESTPQDRSGDGLADVGVDGTTLPRAVDGHGDRQLELVESGERSPELAVEHVGDGARQAPLQDRESLGGGHVHRRLARRLVVGM